jgi:hypothetical protein
MGELDSEVTIGPGALNRKEHPGCLPLVLLLDQAFP